MARNKTVRTVGPTAVREWAEGQEAFKGAKFVTRTAEGTFPRGRLPLAVIEAFQADTGNVYSASHRDPQMVEVSVTKFSPKGRKRTVKQNLTRQQVLTAAGLATNHKGVLSKVTIAAAEAALSDPAPAPAEA
jgi:hypothetical protein